MSENIIQWQGAYNKAGSSHKNRYPSEQVVGWVLSQQKFRGRALDIGCGWGNNLRFLLGEGYDAHGIDFAQSAIDGIGCEFGGRVSCQSIERTNFPENHFDFAIDRCSLQHNPSEKLPLLFSEIRRIIRPGGRLFSIMRRSGDDGFLHAAPTEEQLRAIFTQGWEIISLDLLIRTEQNQQRTFESFIIDVRKV